MKTLIIKTVCLFALVVFVAGNIWSQSAEQLFQKGIMKEEGEGSLREAIELYKSVADDTQAERALRAKALYQMGNCYEKLGQQEARGVYEKLVANYSDQPELVINAKRKLNKLNVDQAASDNSGIAIRQVPFYGVEIHAYSPDGRYANYINWDNQEIGVVDLKSGKKWEITKDGDWYTSKMHYPLNSIWSPDSKQVIYDWNIEEYGKDKSTYNYELHMVDKDGTNDRTIIRNGNKHLWAADWSKDGSTILCVESNVADSSSLVLISVFDGTKRVIADIGYVRNINATFTDDGNFIVFRARAEKGSENYDLFIVSKEGGAVRPLIANKEDDGAPFRISGTNQIVYFSNHSGTKDLWAVTLTGGKVQGEPVILKNDFDQTCGIVGTNNSGTLFYTSLRLNPEIYKARLNFNTNEVTTEPVNIKRNSGRQIIRAIWSPSFKYVAGLIQTPVNTETRLAPLKFVIQNVLTGEENEISPDLSSYLLLWWVEPQWAPNEKSILIKGENKDGLKGIFQIDVKTGKVSEYKAAMEYMYWEWRWLQFSPDFQTQYFVTQDEGQKVVARSVKSGQEKILTEFPDWVDKVLLSPDGKTLAVQYNDSLWILPSDGTGEKKKIESFEKLKGNPIGWSTDCNEIYVAKDDAQKGLSLWELPFVEGSPKEIFTPEKLKLFKGADGLKICHVGNEVYLTMQNGGRITEYWAVENIAKK
jgi:Tol biopolymer transport system component